MPLKCLTMASLVTRCPACGTLFKVVPDQLRISEGWVRCGQCDEVFDAQVQMQPQVVAAPDAAPPPQMPTEAAPPSDLQAVETACSEVTIVGAQIPTSDDADAGLSHAISNEMPDGAVEPEMRRVLDDPTFTESAVQSPLVVDADNVPLVQASFLKQKTAKMGSGKWRWGLRLGGLLLGLVLAVQIVLQQRDRIAATEPGLTAMLNIVCQVVGCRVAPLRQIESIVIESSSFIKVRADVYRLSFSIKNTALVPLALPSAELALTDLRDQSVVRRVLAPEEYGARVTTLGPGDELSAVVPLNVKAVGATNDKVTGYRLLVFYP